MSGLTILVLAKAPCPGRSKTRLAPAFGFDGAAALAGAALADTLDAVAGAAAERRVLVLDGDVSCTVPAGFDVVPQSAGTHADRIEAALAAWSGPTLLIGMDTPHVTPDLLSIDDDSSTGAWFGPAVDGGWWALGLRDPARDAGRVLRGIPTSTPRTGGLQWERLIAAGLRPALLPMLRDVDEPADAFAVAEDIPTSRFGRLVRRLAPADGVAVGHE